MSLKTEDVSTNGIGVAVQHPLDPLTAGEITEVARVLEDHFQWGKDLRVETIDINEPAKDVVRHYDPKNPPPRVARFNVYKHGVMGVWQGLVDLGSAKVISKTFRESARPMLAVQEILDIEATVKADARFQEALRRRGLLAELEYICVDPWTTGDFNIPIEQGRRVLNCFIWMRMFPLDNFYAHPVEGLHALIDVSTLEVLDVHDHFSANGDYIPVPRTPLNYDAELLHQFRKPSSRLDVVQPDGAGFVVEGNEVTWENWDFRVGFNGREGLVLYTIGYTQEGKRRPIVYRASIAEMVVPYGTPERSHYRKNVFDSGELGFGRMATSLKLG
jgi:primary-amine oxidase